MTSSTVPPQTGRTVLVLGGGVGGVIAARRLRRKLPRRDRVILIERAETHLFQPSLLWLAVGDRAADRIQRPLDGLRRAGVEVVRESIIAIDPVTRTVRTERSTFVGDAMIIALGAELAPQMIPGLADAGHNLYDVAGATALRDALARWDGGRVAMLTAAPAYKCPAAPYEAAMLIEGAVRRRGARDRSTFAMHAAEPGPMGVAGPAVGAAIRGMLEAKGIAYHPGRQVTTVDATARQLTFADGATADFDLLVYVPPHRAPAAVRDNGMTNESGWIPVDRTTFATQYPGVFAIGDVTTVPLAMGRPLPKAGVFAHAAGKVVADNLIHEWTGRGTARAFDGRGSCFVETGDGRAAMGGGDFYAEPTPVIRLRPPARRWHWAKIAFEQYWLRMRL